MTLLDLAWMATAMGEATESKLPQQGMGPWTRLCYEMGDRIQTASRRFIYQKDEYGLGLAGMGGPTSTPSPLKAHTERDEYGEIPDIIGAIPIDLTKLYFRAANNSLMLGANPEVQIEKYIRQALGYGYRTLEYLGVREATTLGGLVVDPANTDFAAGQVLGSFTLQPQDGLRTFDVAADWSVNTTQILTGPGQLPAAVKSMRDQGFTPQRLLYNRNTAINIGNNDDIKDYAVNNGGQTRDYLANRGVSQIQGIPAVDEEVDINSSSIYGGLGDVQQWAAWDHIFEDRAGANQTYIPDDVALLVARDNQLRKVLGYAQGPVFMPGENRFGRQASDVVSIGQGLQVYIAQDGDFRPNYTIIILAADRPFIKNRDGVLRIKTNV